MTRKEMLLTKLSEECNETAQRVSKVLCFGMDEVQVGQSLSNSERLIYEFNDILAVMEMLYEEGHIPYYIERNAIDLKKKKVEKYLGYSKECGTLQE